MKRLLPLLLILLPLSSIAETPEEKGLAISIEADRRDRGWHDQTADLIMTLQNKHGQQGRRNMRALATQVENYGDRPLTIFYEPRDVKGTALLS